MTTRSSGPRSGARWTAATLAALFTLGACGGDGGGPVEPETGTLEVTASTTGDPADEDGYSLQIDGDDGRPIGPNETLTVDGVPAGETMLELTDLSEACSVEGENPRSVSVSGGETTSTTFDVACGSQGSGEAVVTATTTGDDPDADGYTVTVDPGTDGAPSEEIEPDGEVTFTDLAEGEHDFELSGVANNCAVDGENPRTANVPADGSVEVAFEVACSGETGDLEVSASTSGDTPDGQYEVQIDGTQSDSVGPNATVSFEGLATGDHDVELVGESVPDGCEIGGDNPRTVSVAAGETASTTFEVTCSGSGSAALEVSVETTGEQQPDGYTVALDPDTPEERTVEAAANETVTFEDVTAGDHEVGLADVPDNCDPEGENPTSVTVSEEDGGSVAFTVGCWAPLDDRVVFESERDGNTDIYVMDPDGAGVERLTDHPAEDANPHVSPDGNRIVFQSGRGDPGPHVWVMNADGSGAEQLVDFNGFNPQWSPAVPPGESSEHVAFARGGSSDRDIWIVDVEDGGAERLRSTADCDDLPTWSPDASRIAFTSTPGSCGDADSDVWTMAADGSGSATQVTTQDGFDGNPTWAEQSDGTNLIAFSRGRNGNEDVIRVTVDADGTAPRNETPLTDDGSIADGYASFSPDGARIVFTSDRDGNEEIYVMDADGSDPTRLTDAPESDRAPAWSVDLP